MTLPATELAAATAALCGACVSLSPSKSSGVAYSSAYARSCSSRNGREKGCRAMLSQCQKGNRSNEVLSVGKHVELRELVDFLLVLVLCDEEM
jgi:hypothetical protein